uniref:Uncharacterized protein n=1 Tax=Candidatus Kentrum sp. TUN TaxID=2126343 RepID=A0A450ZVH9_9GAMM|nr:MAG: hypothetical protein BECKTUN1418F_GA0071002_10484 [Candidatus Kentron sp. TUN]VFK57785.1 MAG: hypothetical protein BECKTUN1418E_GA0071001_10474 [Candidatus Kentron sp. TUN]VFK63907.1 MAG: hypothetical protein BECKTUN1418D_GA0071000_12312 [Candidatus Kentron sp. TUN]
MSFFATREIFHYLGGNEIPDMTVRIEKQTLFSSIGLLPFADDLPILRLRISEGITASRPFHLTFE